MGSFTGTTQNVQDLRCLRPRRHSFCCRTSRIRSPRSLRSGEAPPPALCLRVRVADDYSKANFKKTETQDANGLVAGSFVIALPDGRIRTTTYTADHVNGFVADVTYEGTPVYPPEPAG